MIDSHLRQNFDRVFINPVLNKINISPKTLTLFSCLFGLVAGSLIALQYTLFALLCLAVSGYLDILDGAVARAQNKTTSFGAVLDIVSDRIVEFSVVMGLFLISPESRGLIALLMMGSILICVTSFLVVGIFETNNSHKSFHYSPGIMERAEAFLIFSLMVLLPNHFTLLGTLFTLLVLLTALIRVYQFQR